MLNYTINYGIGTYTERKLANTVWNLIESYGFGSVERNLQKINWYDTEERKELMANIVLNNTGFAEKLGYGNETGSMDHLFAARLAVLTFVDWVDREYVENSWISSLAAAFGVNIRLADLVNQVFDISGFVLTSIRSQLNKAWEGLKSSSEYIINSVLSVIHNIIIDSIALALEGLLIIMSQFLPEFSYQKTLNSFVIFKDGNILINLSLNADSDGFSLGFDEKLLLINQPLLFTEAEVDTLSIDIKTGFGNLLIGTILKYLTSVLIATGLGVRGSAVPPNVLMTTILAIIALTFQGLIIDLLSIENSENKTLLIERLSSINLGFGLGLISFLIDRSKSTYNSDLYKRTVIVYERYGALIESTNGIGKNEFLLFLLSVLPVFEKLKDLGLATYESIVNGNLDHLPNSIITFLYGIVAGMSIKIAFDTTIGKSKVAPSSAIKIYAPILWVIAIIHIVFGSLLLKVIVDSL
jgi:hypothetical protein